MEKIQPTDPMVPSAPLQERLLTAFILEGRNGFGQRYARRLGLTARTAQRHLRDVLQRPAVSLFLADGLAVVLGSHLDILYPEDVAVVDEAVA